MKNLILISIILLISGCTQDCKPVPCKKIYPKLPLYKVPAKKSFTKPIFLKDNLYAVKGDELKDVFKTNHKLRNICYRYYLVNTKVNKEYNNESSNSRRP